MNNQEKEFNRAAETLKGASLSMDEKSAMLKSIYETVADTPLITSSIPSPFAYSYFFKRRTLVALTAVFLMTATTSYASLASLGSLPGDPLYQMKVGVIEPIGLAVRFKEEERNEYRVALLKERVAEIERLKEGGRLVSQNEMASYAAAQRNVIEIEASTSFDAEGENIELSSQVETYNAIITGEGFKLKTRVNATLTKEEPPSDSASTTLSKDAAILSTPEIEEVDEVIEEVVKPTKEVVKPVVKEIDNVVKETVKPIVEEVVPIKIDLGL